MYKKSIAIIIALLFIMQMLSIYQNVEAVDTGSSVEIRLYMRVGDTWENSILETNDAGGIPNMVYTEGNVASFYTIPLEKTINAILYQESNRYGFRTALAFIKGSLSSSTWRLIVYDENKIIAETTYSKNSNSQTNENNLFIPLKDEYQGSTYIFNKGNRIRYDVKLETGSGGNILTNADSSAHLRFSADYLSHNADTFNKDEKTKQKTWQPYLPDEEKRIVIKGTIQDAFSNADFKDNAITISIKLGNEEKHNGTIRKDDNDNQANKSITKDNSKKEYNYRYVYNYSKDNLVEGNYTVYVSVNTNQYTFETKTYFEISRYGIFIKVEEGQDEIESSAEIDLSTAEGKEKELELDILNTGSENGKVNINPNSNDWKILPTSTFDLNGGDKKHIIAKFTPPGDAKAGDRYSATIVADLIVKDVVRATHQITVNVKIVKRHALSMDPSEMIHTFSPEESYTFSITIENNGGEDENYTFSREIVGETPSGWDIKQPEPQTMYVKAGEKKENALKVEVKASNFDKEKDYIVYVNGNNGKSGAEMATDSTKLILKARIGINLTVEGEKTAVFDVEKNRVEKTFTVRVENTGDKTNEYELSVNTQGGISATLGTTSLNLTPGNYQNINLRVSAEKGAIADNYNIRIIGKIKNTDRIVMDYLTIKVKQYYDMDVSIPNKEQKVKPGEEITYKISITNKGNGNDSFSVSYSVPSGWEVRFSNSSSTETVKPSKTSTITMKIRAPKSVKSGEKATIKISVKSSNSQVFSEETIYAIVEKDMFNKFIDSFKDSWYFFVLLIAVFLVFVFVQKQRKQIYK